MGKKPSCVERDEKGNLIPNLQPQLKLEVPVLFSAMSYGSLSYNAHESLARAAAQLGILYNTGEGGLMRTSTGMVKTLSSRSHPDGSAFTRTI